MPLRAMSLVPPSGMVPRKVSASLGGRPAAAIVATSEGRSEVVFEPAITVRAGQSLDLALSEGDQAAENH